MKLGSRHFKQFRTARITSNMKRNRYGTFKSQAPLKPEGINVTHLQGHLLIDFLRRVPIRELESSQDMFDRGF